MIGPSVYLVRPLGTMVLHNVGTAIVALVGCFSDADPGFINTTKCRAVARLTPDGLNVRPAKLVEPVRGEFLLMPRLACERVRDNGHANDTISRSRRR
jgi:hypothetical protein